MKGQESESGMATKGGGLYLYLALACFAGIIAIFVVDGYLGIYDTLYVTAQEREQEIEPDYWQQPWVKEQGYRIAAEWGEPVHFRYEIDNRTFSTYLTDVEASLWKSGEELIELLDEDIAVASFGEATVDWTLRAEELEAAGSGVGEYTVQIRHGEVERRVVLSYRYPAEVPPPPPPMR